MFMLKQILATKIYIPRPHPGSVSRARLIDRLNTGTHGKLTLISAPAGFGKTTLVTEWIANDERPVAWFSLDQDDSDPVRFLTYVVSALQTIVPGIGVDIVNLLASPSPPPIDSLLTPLINELATISHEIFLVLDDYHIIDSQAIDSALTFLIDHQPPQMHLIITTREDPRLPLARLRARRQLTEIRVADLRFTTDESSEFLNNVMELNLSSTDVVALEKRTEGWIAGLQLSAISIQGQADKAAFIESFTGSHRYIMDYLLEEVLSQQTEEIRQFLLQTSILDRLNGELCDAVTGQTGSHATLEQLEKRNLFVVTLDHSLQWYRYHHLFSDLLRHRLQKTQAALLQTLHRRAAFWYENHTSIEQAIQHYIKARDHASAVTLIERVGLTMINDNQWTQLPRWLTQLPDTVIQASILLRTFHAWYQFRNSQEIVSEKDLQDIENALDSNASSGNMNPAQIQELQGQVATMRSYIALHNLEFARSIELAHRALDLLSKESTTRGHNVIILGHAYFRSDNIKEALKAYTEAKNISDRIGNTYQQIAAMSNLGRMEFIQAHLKKALKIFQDVIDMSVERKEQGKPQFSVIGYIYIHKSRCLYQLNQLESALACVQEALRIAAQYNRPDIIIEGYTMLVRIHSAQGDFDIAYSTLQQLDKLLRNPQVDMSQRYETDIGRICLWLTQGLNLEARRWAEERKLSLADEIGFVHDPEYILFAYILISEITPNFPNISDVLNLLNRLLEKAETSGRIDEVLEIYCLSALAHYSYGEIETALPVLSRALSIAESEGYIRVFVDYGSKMVQLLYEAVKQGIYPEYCSELLKSFPNENDTDNSDRVQSQLSDPLSERELEILRLVAEGLSNREIGERLFLALDTIKGHNRRIYAKLDVRRRTEAIARARDLGLL